MMPYIKVFTDMSATVDLLSDAEAGRLFKAVLHYSADVEDELPGQEKLVFAMLKSQIDRDAASYRDFCDKQRENGLKGGRPKKPTVSTKNPENPTVFSKTQKSQDKEKDKDKEKEKDNIGVTVTRARGARFTQPTIEEVKVYCNENGFKVDAERFVAYYESNGWRVGRNPMKDWRAAVRTWARNDAGSYSAPSKPTATAMQFEQRSYTGDELRALTDADFDKAMKGVRRGGG